jgi:hypothetical protein
METKILLRLIMDDISHLQGIISEFTMESLPPSDEVELALVRANTLLRQLELLHKLTEKNEKTVITADQKPPNLLETITVKNTTVQDITVQPREVSADNTFGVGETQGETLRESHQMVNDILSQEKSESGYQIIPINRIRDGIGINDRFLFVRELFENNSSKFETAVEAIDQLSTIQDAVNYLKMNFKWHKTEASQKFLVLVKRRFTK